MKRKPSLEKESDIQRTILAYLQLKRIFSYRINAGKVRQGNYWIKLAPEGHPDIVAIKDGQYIGLEVKRPGKNQTPEQEAFQRSLIFAGAEYHVVRSLEDVEAIFP